MSSPRNVRRLRGVIRSEAVPSAIVRALASRLLAGSLVIFEEDVLVAATAVRPQILLSASVTPLAVFGAVQESRRSGSLSALSNFTICLRKVMANFHILNNILRD